MGFTQSYSWLVLSKRRKEILLNFNQPLTTKQISQRTHIPLNFCIRLLWELKLCNFLRCLNQDTHHNNKVYWLTPLGKRCQKELRKSLRASRLEHFFPQTDWSAYGAVCFKYRSAVIKALNSQMRNAQIRKVLTKNYGIRVGYNNVREVLTYLTEHGIAKKIITHKSPFPRYELTGTGQIFRQLLMGAKVNFNKPDRSL